MRRMRTQNKTRKLGCPFPLCVTSELGTKYIDEMLLNITKLGNLRKEGKLNDEIQADIQQNTQSRKRKYANY